MKYSFLSLACLLALGTGAPAVVQAQQLTSNAQATVQITKGATPAALRRKLREDLEIRAVRNLLEASFAIKMTPQVEAKLPEIVELLGDAIEISVEPSDGETLRGRARIAIASAKLKEYLTNKGIGAGDIATRSARILVSIDEFIGVATRNDGSKPTEVEINYSHDKSRFSDTSAKASGSQSQSASESSSVRRDVAASTQQASAASGRQSAAFSASESSAVAARRDTAVAGRSDAAFAAQGSGGAASGASRSQFAGASSSQMAAASNSQVAGARSSEFAAAQSSKAAMTDRSQMASASSSSSASSFSAEQNNVQQQNDKVSYSVRTKMPEFNNAKPLAGPDQVLSARLSGEFQNAGLRLVAENDLRAEGGRILPVWEITNNGRIDQFVGLIPKKNIEADVWATGQASYTIVGSTPTGTQCNGNLSVQARFIDGNEVFFVDSLQAAATGNGDQDCRARLGIALATSLAKVLGERANKELNARASRGSVYTLYLYSATSLGRGDRNKFQTVLRKVEGIQASEPRIGDNFMVVSVQMAGSLDTAINNVLDALAWEKADYVSRPGNRICIGLEGKQVCPADLR